MSFAFFVSLLGFAFAIRTLDKLIARKLISRDELPKIGTAFFASVMVLILFLPKTRVSFWCAIFAPVAAFAIMLSLIIVKRSRDFQNAFAESLTMTLLKMKSGKSFRQSFAETISESESGLRTKLAEVGSVVVFSQQKPEITSDAFVSMAIDELVAIDRQPHSSMRRLILYRDRIRMEDEFRRRSGQVLARIRAQSFVMTGLYFAILGFVVWKFGWLQNIRIVAVSSLLFTLGSLWIWLGGRRLKWKA